MRERRFSTGQTLGLIKQIEAGMSDSVTRRDLFRQLLPNSVACWLRDLPAQRIAAARNGVIPRMHRMLSTCRG